MRKGQKYATREEWLNAAAALIAKEFEWAFEAHFGKPGLKHVRQLHVSAGFPSRGGETGKVIGQCWNSKVSRDQFHHIFVSPLLDVPAKVLGTLAHEMVHAADDGEHKHKGPFVKCGRDLGLVGKPTCMGEGGEEFAEFVKRAVKELGVYPHTALVPTLKTKTQKTYMLKVQCRDCDCVVRMTEKWIETSGLPTCGCGGTMEEA